LPIDFAGLDKLCATTADRTEILQDFMAQTCADLADLETALIKPNMQVSVRIAHRMKGASRMVGARELAAACLAMENAARQGHLEDADAVKTALDRLTAHLTETACTNKDKK